MSDKVYWIAIDFDHVPDGEEMKRIGENIQEGLDHECIVTTREVEPLDREDVEGFIKELERALVWATKT